MKLSSLLGVWMFVFTWSADFAAAQPAPVRLRITKLLDDVFAADLFLPRGECLFVGYLLPGEDGYRKFVELRLAGDDELAKMKVEIGFKFDSRTDKIHADYIAKSTDTERYARGRGYTEEHWQTNFPALRSTRLIEDKSVYDREELPPGLHELARWKVTD